VFENILGQERVVALLSSDLESGTLPASLLFYGEPYSGKLSTALELSRVLSCTERGSWNCSCRSCRESRLLSSPYTLMLGSRYFVEEAAAAGDTLERTPSPATCYLYIRAVRKLIHRFDPVLWEGNESKLKKVRSQVEKIADSIDSLDPEKLDPGSSGLEKLIKENNKAIEKISASGVSRNIPIDQIRNVSFWCRSVGSDYPKMVILEGADNMVEGSRNALLKLLEEPPENTHILLLTDRKGGIIQTILSRVRQYPFVPRTKESSADVLKRIFRVEEEYDSLRHFFLAWKGVRTEKLKKSADSLLKILMEGGRYEVEEFDTLLNEISTPEQFIPFLEELTAMLGSLLETFPPELVSRWNSLIRDAYNKRTLYNQSAALLMESLLYQMAYEIERGQGHA
jgi:DNA polymerase III subunit gamma/tau